MPSNPEETHTDTQKAKTGVLLVNEGFVRQEDVETALGIQRRETLQPAVRSKTHPRTIGEILCDLNLITPTDLGAVLKKYSKYLKLEQILIRQGSADEKLLTAVLQVEENRREPVGKILLQKGIITETQLYEAYSLQHNLPYKPFDRFALTPEDRAILSGIIGKDFAHRFGVLPVAVGQKRLGVVISDPENLRVIDALRTRQTDLRIECTFVTIGTFSRLFNLLYEKPPPEPRSESADSAPPRKQTAADSRGGFPARRPPPSADKIVQFIINNAVQSKAETIHLQLKEAGATLKFALQGKLTRVPPLWFEKRFREIAGEVILRIKEMAGIVRDDTLRPREGIIQTTYKDQLSGHTVPVTFSVAVCPTLEGEDLTLSRLSQGQKNMAPVTPVLSEAVRIPFYRLLKKGSGLILVTGPKESHLAGTIHATLSDIQNQETPIVTVEDPIRYHLPGSVQIEVPAVEGLSWDALFRSALKLGPEVMVIDRLKDADATRCVCEIARSGPLFISTLCAEDAVNALTRLRMLGIAPYLLADCLGGILSQRALEKLCDKCKIPYVPSASEWTALFSESPDHLIFYRKTGCRACRFSGYSGQVFLSELLPVTEPLLDAIRADAPEETLRRIAIEQGMRTLMDDGLARLDEITIETLLTEIPVASIAAFKSKPRRDKLASPWASVYTEMLSDPGAQREAVVRLHAAYERLAFARGVRTSSSDPLLFGKFIQHHFDQIRERYRCHRVLFSILDRQPRIIITATPVQPSGDYDRYS